MKGETTVEIKSVKDELEEYLDCNIIEYTDGTGYFELKIYPSNSFLESGGTLETLMKLLRRRDS